MSIFWMDFNLPVSRFEIQGGKVLISISNSIEQVIHMRHGIWVQILETLVQGVLEIRHYSDFSIWFPYRVHRTVEAFRVWTVFDDAKIEHALNFFINIGFLGLWHMIGWNRFRFTVGWKSDRPYKSTLFFIFSSKDVTVFVQKTSHCFKFLLLVCR